MKDVQGGGEMSLAGVQSCQSRILLTYYGVRVYSVGHWFYKDVSDWLHKLHCWQ